MPSQLFQGMLFEYGAVTRSALFEMLPEDQEPWRHHYDLMAEYPRRGGRMLRACLVLATARAFGGKVEDALGPAVTVETLHNALLVHGDVFDLNELRRGGPALHRLLGVPLAINVGDSLTLTSLRPLIEARYRVGARLTLRLLEETERMLAEYSAGRADELTWRRQGAPDVDEAAFLRMVLQGDAWLHGVFPVRLGALVATRDRFDLDRCVAFGFFIATALKIRDELAGLETGLETGNGRLLCHDQLLSDRRGFLLQDLLTHASENDKTWLRGVLRRPRDERTAEDAERIRGLVRQHGTVDRLRDLQKQYAAAAGDEHRRVLGDLGASRDKQFLGELAEWAGLPETDATALEDEA